LTQYRATRYAFENDISEDLRLTESRALACELVAWQFLTFLAEKELIDHLLYELPVLQDDTDQGSGIAASSTSPNASRTDDETTPFLDLSHVHDAHSGPLHPPKCVTTNHNINSGNLPLWVGSDGQDDLAKSMAGLNALEIAAVSNAKKFLSQTQVQSVVENIWHGDIIFWESLSSRAQKCPKIYNKHTADPFSRLRVPKYQKAFQVAFFIAFLILYYAVLVQRNTMAVTGTEVLLYVWIAAFAYDEFGEFQDAGYLFYQTDFWSIWDLAIILVGVAFFITRMVGLVRHDARTTGIAFDVLSMLALFLVPRSNYPPGRGLPLNVYRICSVASLNPYFGSLLPVLKEMVRSIGEILLHVRLTNNADHGFLQILTCHLHPLSRISHYLHHARSRPTQSQRSLMAAHQSVLRI